MFILGLNDKVQVLMRIAVPDISKQVFKEEMLEILIKKYSVVGPMWANHQTEWINGVYASFKDHDKFLIMIFLIKKTLDFYSRNFIKLTYDEFYSKDSVEIEKFNISEISTNVNIPKESARRKIIELEKSGIIKRFKKKIIIDRSTYPFVKPENSIKRISRFLSVFSEMLKKEKIIPKNFSSVALKKIIENNFSYVWKIYYELQIPMMLGYKKIFNDLETFHIFGTCVVNQHLHAENIEGSEKKNRIDFIKTVLSDSRGINAMSISDITGIPRATVIRKLQKLIKNKNLTIDEKKHYRISGVFYKELMPLQHNVLMRLSDFSCKIFNLVIL